MPENTARDDQVTYLLSQYQLLEFSLKIYISGAYSLIKQRLEEIIPFKYGYKTIECSPLEKLIQIFSQLSDNENLIARLRTIKKHRNYIAHRALVEQSSVIRDVLGLDSEESPIDFELAAKEIDECLIAMATELEFIVQHQGNPDEAV